MYGMHILIVLRNGLSLSFFDIISRNDYDKLSTLIIRSKPY